MEAGGTSQRLNPGFATIASLYKKEKKPFVLLVLIP
jgi:hypothetical protein